MTLTGIVSIALTCSAATAAVCGYLVKDEEDDMRSAPCLLVSDCLAAAWTVVNAVSSGLAAHGAVALAKGPGPWTFMTALIAWKGISRFRKRRTAGGVASDVAASGQAGTGRPGD